MREDESAFRNLEERRQKLRGGRDTRHENLARHPRKEGEARVKHSELKRTIPATNLKKKEPSMTAPGTGEML